MREPKAIHKYRIEAGDCIRLRAQVNTTDEATSDMLVQLCYGTDVSYTSGLTIGVSQSLTPIQAVVLAPFFKRVFDEVEMKADFCFHVLNMSSVSSKYEFIYKVVRDAYGHDKLPMTWENACFLFEIERRMMRLEDVPIFEERTETVKRMVENWFHGETYQTTLDGFLIQDKLVIREGNFTVVGYKSECLQALHALDYGIFKHELHVGKKPSRIILYYQTENPPNRIDVIESQPMTYNYEYEWPFMRLTFHDEWPMEIVNELSKNSRSLVEKSKRLKKHKAQAAVDIYCSDVHRPFMHDERTLVYPAKRLHPGLTSKPAIVKASSLICESVVKQLTEKQTTRKRGRVRLLEEE